MRKAQFDNSIIGANNFKRIEFTLKYITLKI